MHDICGGPAGNALECTGIISVVRQAADTVGMLGTCALIELYRQGRFPMDRLVPRYAFDQIEEALMASYAGDVIKPIVHMPT
ncbi:hypothetical protein [Streptomyces sp. 11x1]|uniref:hypothetical protein n=1 Tax=Streptomyces sp. 11x1 TaxID=3038642 RepID=UPI002931761C|nr:hypothetical protein [Streptomyces sp. 11x1]WNZ14226.1 hypothetical protein P8T65_46180 [Streptomyces sp. 11x1]